MPSDEYISTRLAVAQERISYGGSRLAALVADIYGYSINPEVQEEEEDSIMTADAETIDTDVIIITTE